MIVYSSKTLSLQYFYTPVLVMYKLLLIFLFYIIPMSLTFFSFEKGVNLLYDSCLFRIIY